jgi:hypothetical protein
VDTRADGGDVSGDRLSSDGCGLLSDGGRLGCDGCGLGGNRGIDCGHASHNTQRVSLGEVGGLRSRIDGRGVLEAC